LPLSKVLILFSSVDGHTETICLRLRQILECAGAQVTVVPMGEENSQALAAMDMVVVGASIRYGYHRVNVVRFMQTHRVLLASRLNAFFSVNLVARKVAKRQPDTNPYLGHFLRRIGWRPQFLEVFAGRLDYPACRPLDRWMIRLIMWMTKGPTDPSTVVDYTDWSQVERFGLRLVDALSGKATSLDCPVMSVAYSQKQEGCAAECSSCNEGGWCTKCLPEQACQDAGNQHGDTTEQIEATKSGSA
jgi:menaquinone-dependent protoporphyrinogen oxidase